MAKDRMQRQRFEMKYLINADRALQIREFVRTYLELDENGVGRPNCSYAVHSLYLDSDNLATYWMTVNSDKNRFKLRLRFYDANPNTPVFFEVKRRVGRSARHWWHPGAAGSGGSRGCGWRGVRRSSEWWQQS